MRVLHVSVSYDAQTSDHRAVQRLHAITQCRSRYGIDLSVGQYLWLCDEVWACGYGAGSAHAERAGHRGDKRYLVTVRGCWVLAAWSEVTMQIATFLPSSCRLVDRQQN